MVALSYPYANGPALVSIHDKSQMWASNALFLNDSQEIIFGRDSSSPNSDNGKTSWTA